jgi:D-aminopeptidase
MELTSKILVLGFAIAAGLLFMSESNQSDSQSKRPRARDIGLVTGVLPTGALNSITDVAGVRVGHRTLIKGDSIRTGVTAILPHGGNMFQEKVPAAIFVGNGFGKLAGSTQVNELGEIETPILLTNTLNVPRVADALIEWMLALPGNEEVRSINPVVGETNDGGLNDIRGRHVSRDDVFAALGSATGGLTEEGSVGAGTGTVCFGWKGGIGSSSRRVAGRLTRTDRDFVVGVLVQTNFGGVLTINGAPVGRELGRYYLREQTKESADGSIIIVVATDAPLEHRNLNRLAARAMLGLARTGSPSTNGSGDYVIAFSTAAAVRIRAGRALQGSETLSNDSLSPLFQAVVEATEEAIYNSLLKATTMTGRNNTKVEALPIDKTVEILEKYRALK